MSMNPPPLPPGWGPPPAPGPGAPDPREPVRRWMRVGAFAAFLAVVAAGAILVFGPDSDLRRGLSDGNTLVVSPSEPTGGLPDVPFRFLRTRTDGSPVRWNPCEPIRYEANLELAPDGAIEDVQEAVRRVQDATGIEFIFEGETTDSTADRLDGQIAELGPDGRPRFEPVLIVWVEDAEMKEMAGGELEDDVMGYARPIVRKGVFVGGVIAMRASLANVTGFGFVGTGPVVQHEWGHIVGLDHVATSSDTLMGEYVGRLDWGEGDLRGLERLGREQGCLVTPRPPVG